MIEAFLFYMFSGLLILSAAMVISIRNPVHAVLFLIVAFFNAAALFLMAGAELLAMLLVIVYVGAVAVLFLFVVMMLDINFQDMRQGVEKYGILGGCLGLILVIELAVVGITWVGFSDASLVLSHPYEGHSISNAHSLGQLLYTHYFYVFQLSGMILLVAMVGAIVLTLKPRPHVHRQSARAQIDRRASDTLKMKKPPFRSGVKTS